jgi:uncharacterized surface protein with fasciclin (FAS1) repeats
MIKRTRTRMMALGLAAGLVALSACGSDSNDSTSDTTTAVEEAETEVTEAMEEAETETSEMGGEAGTIVDVAVGAGLDTLVAAVTAAELGEALSAEGPLTVFAPTEEAFAALPEGLVACLLEPENKDALSAILTYHVVDGLVTSGDLANGDVPTLQGENVTVDITGGAKINDATVVQADVTASNGVVHVVDAVLVPPSIDVEAFLAGCA